MVWVRLDIVGHPPTACRRAKNSADGGRSPPAAEQLTFNNGHLPPGNRVRYVYVERSTRLCSKTTPQILTGVGLKSPEWSIQWGQSTKKIGVNLPVFEISGSKVRDPRKIAIFFFEKITASPLWDSEPRNWFMNMRKRCGYHNLKSASRQTQTKKLENSKTGKIFPKIAKNGRFFFSTSCSSKTKAQIENLMTHQSKII